MIPCHECSGRGWVSGGPADSRDFFSDPVRIFYLLPLHTVIYADECPRCGGRKVEP